MEAMTWVIAALFLARASFAVGAWLVTPVEISTLSGGTLTSPVAATEMVRFGVSSARARGGANIAAEPRARMPNSHDVWLEAMRSFRWPTGRGTSIARTRPERNALGPRFAGGGNPAMTQNARLKEQGP